MKFLFDTNVLIAAEPTAPLELEDAAPTIIDLIRTANKLHYQLYVHPFSLDDLDRDNDANRKRLRKLLIRKYQILLHPPKVTTDILTTLKITQINPHDSVDLGLLVAVYKNAVDYLITQDHHLFSKARRLSIRERVVTPEEALSALNGLYPSGPSIPPAVNHILAYQLNERDPIFDSFRRDYPNFDKWLAKCKREHRSAFIIYGDRSEYAAVAIFKDSPSPEHGLSTFAHKLCSFKVSNIYLGRGYSELLLKAIFNYAYNLNGDSLFVSVFERYKPLILFFEEFGFESSGAKTNLGELVLVKKMKRNPNEAKDWSDYVDFNRKYGPKLFLLEGTKPVVIPILPKYHKILFPDAEPNALLFSGAFVSGNAIRKAYLCYSKIKEIAPGTPALFYRSSDMQFFQCVGVIEKSIRSSDPNELARLVGIRTVYSYSEIEKMCKKEVFALLFRHARILFPPLTIDKVIQAGLLKRAPRSITRIKEGGIQ